MRWPCYDVYDHIELTNRPVREPSSPYLRLLLALGPVYHAHHHTVVLYQPAHRTLDVGHSAEINGGMVNSYWPTCIISKSSGKAICVFSGDLSHRFNLNLKCIMSGRNNKASKMADMVLYVRYAPLDMCRLNCRWVYLTRKYPRRFI